MTAASAAGSIRRSLRKARPGSWCTRKKTIDETATAVKAISTSRSPRKMSALRDSIGSNIVGRGRSLRKRPLRVRLVLQDRELVPVRVVEGVGLRALDVRLGQKDAHAVDERRVGGVIDHQLGRLFVIGKRILGLLGVCALDQRVHLRVGVAGAAVARIRDEQVVEPVLRVVVVGLPAVAEDGVLLLGATREERLALRRGQVNLDTEVILPL